jgi:hypothetical protein
MREVACYRHERKLDSDNKAIATWLIKLTDNNRNWGFGLCYLYLRNLKGRSGSVYLNRFTPMDK